MKLELKGVEVIFMGNGFKALQKASDIKTDYSNITVFHGTKNICFNLNPSYRNHNNDYGFGFYTTPSLELAKEWAMSKFNNTGKGIVIEYNLDLSDLNILDLSNYDVMYWVTTLLNNRTMDDLSQSDINLINRLNSKYLLDIDSYDVIIGYMADDSYFKYIQRFLNNRLSKDALYRPLLLGKLGIQYCIKSDKAYSHLYEIKRHKASTEDGIRFNNRERMANSNLNKIYLNDTSSNVLYKILIEEGL